MYSSFRGKGGNDDLYYPTPPAYYYWKDLEGVYQNCSEALQQILPNNIVGKTDKDIWPHKAKVILKTDKEVIKFKSTIITELTFSINEQEKIFSVTKIPWLNKQKKMVGTVGHLYDITHFKQREYELQAEKNSIAANMNNIVICTPGSIYWKNREGVYLGCNDFMVKEAGLKSRSDIIGKTDEILWPTHAKDIRKNDLEVMSSGKPISLEETVGGKFFFSQKMPLRDEKNKVIGVICNSHDVTYLKEVEGELRKAKERSEAANRAKSEFLALVSHELRSPLTIILGMIHFLSVRENILLEQRVEYIDNISVAAKHLLSLVNDILDLAKLDAEQFGLMIAPLDFKQLISETITIFMPQAQAKGLKIFLDYDENIPGIILGDLRALKQIIINLVNNALKFTEVGYISIKVKRIESTTTHVTLVLTIQDTGIGIPKDKLSIIFDNFQQVDTSYCRQYVGTGLGLTITKKLITVMGGSLEVSSELNKGSIFTCSLTFKFHESNMFEHPWMLYQPHVPILIIDDTECGMAICQQMASDNCKVVSSKNAVDTFIMSQQNAIHFGIVIINDTLLFYDPYELAKKIIECPHATRPMLMYLTSSCSEATKRAAIEIGFFDFIYKPIDAKQLQTILTNAWKRWVERTVLYAPGSSVTSQEVFKETVLKTLVCNKKRILLIDDEKVILWVHSEMLKDLGFEVETVNNSLTALEVFEAEKIYDMIFIDMGLPKISGPELVKIRRLKEKSNNTTTPIIALTGYSSQKDQETFLEAGVNEVLVKPVSSSQIKKILMKYDLLTDSQFVLVN